MKTRAVKNTVERLEQQVFAVPGIVEASPLEGIGK
jgi:hypothetical protein